MSKNILLEKSYAFALRVVKLCNYLVDVKREYVLSRKLLDSGTNICAHVESARQGADRADYLNNLVQGAKDAYRSHYWLRLMRDSNYLSEAGAQSMISDCEELRKMLVSSIKSTKVASP